MNSISKISKQNAKGTVEWTEEIVPYKLLSDDEEHTAQLSAGLLTQNAYLPIVQGAQNSSILDPTQSLSFTTNTQCSLLYQVDSQGKPHWMWVVL